MRQSQTTLNMKSKSLVLILFFILLTCNSNAASLHKYAASSVLANGKFVKIGIVESGVYKLTYEKLLAMGMDPQNIQNIHIFGYGGSVLEQDFLRPKIDDLPEIPIYVEKGSDGVFGPGDCVLFYAQGVVKWTYDSSDSIFTHTNNPYSKYGYYFVSSNAVNTPGKRIETKSSVTIPTDAVVKDITEFIDYKVSEKDLRSLPRSGKEFYGDDFNSILNYNYAFNFPNIITTRSNALKVKLDVAAASSTTSNFTLQLNGTQSQILSTQARSSTDQYQMATEASSIFSFNPLGDDLLFSVNYNKPTTISIGYMNFLEVTARRSLKMTGSVMQFQNADSLGLGYYNRYLLSNATANVQVWDISNPQDVRIVPTIFNNDTLSFTDSTYTLKQYIAIDTNTDPRVSSLIPSPINDAVVPNQNLHGTMQQADLVIITHPSFISQAQALAQAHRDKDNLIVEVVTTDQVYNEFSSGTPDATAYRWVMKMLYDRATVPTDLPKSLLLFGRGTFDNKKILSREPESGDNLILTYQSDNSLSQTVSFVTDDYFAYLEDNEGTNISTNNNSMDIGVGRFPVSTTQQASDVVNKVIAYMNNNSKGYWKNQICFLADDGDTGLHMQQADHSASSIVQNYPSYQVNKIYLDAYVQEVSASGQTYPLAKLHFQNLLRSGLFMLNFTGHASPAGWTNEQILSTADVNNLSNTKLPFWWAATCDFMQFDGKTVSGGESVLLNPVGGGIGIVSAARPVYAAQNERLNRLFSDNIYSKVNGVQQTVGAVISAAKNNISPEINKLCYIYMGDPALKLSYPSNYSIITTKVNENTVFGNDTLRALSVASISGIVADQDGNAVNDFNGKMHAIVYDKSEQITTLNNDGDGEAFTYIDRPNALFSGDAVVKNGKFKFTFILPKDIKYNFGTGRINYYAQDDSANVEAQGYFENFIVGGSNPNFIDDTSGPAVNLFLNDSLSIASKVNETPLFMASISDVDGINTVGGGIGHDILLTIDKDSYNSYNLNEYFQAEIGSYTKGLVKFKLPELADGTHTLSLRAWDLLNNSTTKSMTFEVQKGLAPVIFSVSNWPNPVVTNTRFVIVNDRPETLLSATVEIIDLSGRVLWNSGPRASIDNLSWDLTSNSGQKVKPGIYFYRVNLKTTNSQASSKTNKLLIVGK
jgi:Peptidase family C25